MCLDNYSIPIRDLEKLRDSLLSGTSGIQKSLKEIEHRFKYMSNDADLYKKSLENGTYSSKNQIGYTTEAILWNILRLPWHPKLSDILYWVIDRHRDIIITSAARDRKIHKNDSKIHMQDPQRAFDIRSRNWLYPDRIKADINANWIYDPERPHLDVCIYHDTGQGWHFHIQCHSNTKMR